MLSCFPEAKESVQTLKCIKNKSMLIFLLKLALSASDIKIIPEWFDWHASYRQRPAERVQLENRQSALRVAIQNLKT